jgi:crossover junction endodeoxyribonuclease RusA
MPLFEFIVEGPPLSHQTEDRKKLRSWKAKVRRNARRLWNGSPLTIPLQISVAYYHEGIAVLIDNDNMIKPIQDALNQLVYADDRLITDTIIRKTSIDHPIYARRLSLMLLRAFSRGREFLHIQINPAPDHSRTI